MSRRSSSNEELDCEESEELSLCCLCGQTFLSRDSLHEHFSLTHEDDTASLDTPKPTDSPFPSPISLSPPLTPPNLIPQPPRETPALTKEEETEQWREMKHHNSNNRDSKYRIFSCTSCRKSFTKSCNLNSHIKAVHKGVKAFQCSECRKSFSRNSDLQKHIDAVHKGLRPYQCPICQKRFSQKSSLKRHKEAVHEGIKAFQCVHCESRFSYDVHLKRHIRAKHKMVVITSNPPLLQQPAAVQPQAST